MFHFKAGLSRMPLNHVCIWSEFEKCWKPITVEEAKKCSPNGTISAKSQQFLCSRCGQFVLLTREKKRERYFKHSSEEESKSCPDRSNYNSYSKLQPNDCCFPIRLRNLSKNCFQIELGFITLPASAFNKQYGNGSVIIRGRNSTKEYKYLLERFSNKSVTYLNIGDVPCEKYQISYEIDSLTIRKYWPTEVKGFSSNGTLFDGETKKRLSEDSDVVVNHDYYLVTKKTKSQIEGDYRFLTLECISESKVSITDTWYIYKVRASEYHESPARFFLVFHARLTERPIQMYPLWPEYVELPYVILQKEQKINIFMKGDYVHFKTYPETSFLQYPLKNNSSNLISITAKNDIYQILSAGRTCALKYMYFGVSDFDNMKAPSKGVKVTDINGNVLTSGIYNNLPKKSELNVSFDVDGFVEVTDLDGFVLEKYISKDYKVIIKDIKFNTEINVYLGIDCLWHTKFIRPVNNYDIRNDLKIVSSLRTYKDYVSLPHNVNIMSNKLKSHPSLYGWLIKEIKLGRISGKALKILGLIIKRESNNE